MAKAKKRTCPECKSVNVVPISYGLPGPEMFESAERGEIALGGCCVSDDDPRWYCRDCEHSWGRRLTPRQKSLEDASYEIPDGSY